MSEKSAHAISMRLRTGFTLRAIGEFIIGAGKDGEAAIDRLVVRTLLPSKSALPLVPVPQLAATAFLSPNIQIHPTTLPKAKRDTTTKGERQQQW